MDINVLNDSNTEIPHDITEIAENIVNINTLKNDNIASTTFNNINGINSVDYMTLEIMANSDTYNKYINVFSIWFK
jgi:hypothetical protein